MSEAYCVIKRHLDGRFIAVVSGMGRNQGTWDHTHSRRTAQRHAKKLREGCAQYKYTVESAT